MRSEGMLSDKRSPRTHCLSAVPEQETLYCAWHVADHVRDRAAHDNDTGQFMERDREVFEEVGCHKCLKRLLQHGCPVDAAVQVQNGVPQAVVCTGTSAGPDHKH